MVEVDASQYAIGAVLMQKHEDLWCPISYYSRSLSSAEKNYQVYNYELLAIVDCLEEWWHYLIHAKHTVQIFTNHLNLTYFRKPQKINPHQAGWMMFLAEYDFQLHHIPGNKNSAADALSHRPDHDDGMDHLEAAVVLPDTLFTWSIHITSSNTIRDLCITHASDYTL